MLHTATKLNVGDIHYIYPYDEICYNGIPSGIPYNEILLCDDHKDVYECELDIELSKEYNDKIEVWCEWKCAYVVKRVREER